MIEKRFTFSLCLIKIAKSQCKHSSRVIVCEAVFLIILAEGFLEGVFLESVRRVVDAKQETVFTTNSVGARCENAFKQNENMEICCPQGSSWAMK